MSRPRSAQAKKMSWRDANRRISVITKKMKDIQELGIPCVFCYAAPWTGGLFVIGDDRMARVLKRGTSEMLDNLKEESEEATLPDFLLPKLLQPIKGMNGRTLSSIIVGISRDLKLDWAGNSQCGGRMAYLLHTLDLLLLAAKVSL